MLLCHLLFTWKKHSLFLYTELNCIGLQGGQKRGCMLMQHTGAPDLGKQKQLHWFIWLSQLCFASVYVSFCKGCLPATCYLSASPQEDLWRLTSLVKAHESNEQKPQPILPGSTPFCYFTEAYCQHSRTWFPVYDVTIRGSFSFGRKKTRWVMCLNIPCNLFSCHSHWPLLRCRISQCIKSFVSIMMHAKNWVKYKYYCAL